MNNYLTKEEIDINKIYDYNLYPDRISGRCENVIWHILKVLYRRGNYLGNAGTVPWKKVSKSKKSKE